MTANPYIQRRSGNHLSLLGKLFGPEISDRGIPNLARGETFRGAIRIKGEVRGDIRHILDRDLVRPVLPETGKLSVYRWFDDRLDIKAIQDDISSK